MTGVPSYSTTPSENVQANTGINWDEGMPPAAVNNSARQNMTDMRLQWNDASWFQYGTGSKTSVIPAYASGTSFTIAGVDVTAYWHVGRRVKAVGTSTGTIYGTITASAFSTNTTVTVAWDSGSLSNETITVYAATVQATGTPISNACLRANRVYSSALSNPTGTTSSSDLVMMGLGGTLALTPKSTGRVRFTLAGDGFVAAAGNDLTLALRYGTGTAPANGAAVTGTAANTNVMRLTAPGNSYHVPFNTFAEISGLTIGTAYWFDLALQSQGNSLGSVERLTAMVKEIPA